MKVDVKSDQMDMARKALIKGVYKHPNFEKQRLLALERLLLEDGAEKIKEISDIKALQPCNRLAEIAFEEDTEKLRKQELKDSTLKVADVGYYTALGHENKILLVGVRGTSSFEDAFMDCGRDHASRM